MNLLKSRTKWILFLSSSADAEDRHIQDLAFGLYCLESRGISQDDIFIYVDHQDRALVSQLISSGTNNNYTIKESKDFFSDQANNEHENMMMFVTGHGNMYGIEASTPITPYALLNVVKAAPNLKVSVIYLGQCVAGVFNYVSAGKRGNNEPEVILLGATNLHASMSSSTQELLLNGPLTWVANLFLLHVFKWISNPFDIDGDGKLTIMDSCKYAGAMSNAANKEMKALSFVRSIQCHKALEEAGNMHAAKPTPTSKLVRDAAEQNYRIQLDLQHTHQESWILNAFPAQIIEI